MNIKNKKYAGLFLTLLMVSSLVAQVVEQNDQPDRIWVINQPTVAFHKLCIGQQLKRNKYERIGALCATTAVLVGLGWYSFGGLLKAAPVTAGEEVVSAREVSKKIDVLNSQVTILKEQNQRLLNAMPPVSLEVQKKLADLLREQQLQQAAFPKRFGHQVWNFAKGAGTHALNNFAVLLIMGGLPGPITKMFGFWGRKLEELGQRIYHDADFYWFVSTQTQAVQYFGELERCAGQLALAIDPLDRVHQKESVAFAASGLTKQLARIIAFMEYQSDKLRTRHMASSIKMGASARYVYRHVGAFAVELQEKLADASRHAEIPAYISGFREKMRTEQDSFCTHERAALFDISDQVK